MKLPVSYSTTWRWMQSLSIFRDKFKQSYYNDKHQDAAVVEDRARYIKVMDSLALRQPVWLQLSMQEFWTLRERMPDEGVLLYHYQDDTGARMVELHVDLDDSFDLKRAALPLGGHFSVRFPGKTPPDSALRPIPAGGVPPPGAGLSPLPIDETSSAVYDNAGSPAKAPLPTVAMVNKMKVLELKDQLLKLGLDTNGHKPELLLRLRTAISQAQAPESNEEESEEEEWKVKRILSRRVCTSVVDAVTFDVVEYQVQWDYPDQNDPTRDEVTWEAEENLSNALEALHDFFSSQPKQAGCEFGHIQGVCRCSLPLIHVGQDESIFKWPM